MAEVLPQQYIPALPPAFWERKLVELQQQNIRVVEVPIMTMWKIVNEHHDGPFKRETDVRAIVRVPGLLPALRDVLDELPPLVWFVMQLIGYYLRTYEIKFDDRTLVNRIIEVGLDLAMRRVAQNRSLNFRTRRAAYNMLWIFFRTPEVVQIPEPDGPDMAVEEPAVDPIQPQWLPNFFWVQMALEFQDDNETVVYEALGTMRIIIVEHTRFGVDRLRDLTHFMLDIPLLEAFRSILDWRSRHVGIALLVLRKCLDIHRYRNIQEIHDTMVNVGIYQALRDLRQFSPNTTIKTQAFDICRQYFTHDGYEVYGLIASD